MPQLKANRRIIHRCLRGEKAIWRNLVGGGWVSSDLTHTRGLILPALCGDKSRVCSAADSSFFGISHSEGITLRPKVVPKPGHFLFVHYSLTTQKIDPSRSPSRMVNEWFGLLAQVGILC